MRLIKLSTVDDKGQFNTNFTTDINLKPGASIALKSASFEPKIQGFTSNSFSGQLNVRYDADLNNNFDSPIVKEGVYSIGELRQLLFAFNNALNRGLSIKSLRDQTQTSLTALSQYLVYERDEKLHIEYRATPLINPITQKDISSNDTFFIKPRGRTDQFRISGEKIGVRNSNPATSSDFYRLTTPDGVGLSKGSGVFMAQISKSVVTGSPNRNGFKIGIALERTQKPELLVGDLNTNPRSHINDTKMSDASRSFEIEFRDVNHNYRFISAGFGENITGDGEFQDAGFTASSVADGDDKNDVIMFEIDNTATDIPTKIIRGSIIKQVTPANPADPTFEKQVIFTHILTEQEQNVFSHETESHNVSIAEEEETLGIDFVPYIVFRGTEDSIELTNIRCSLNPFITTEDFGEDGIHEIDLENPALPDRINQPTVDSDIASAVQLPLGDDDIQNVVYTQRKSRLSIGSSLAKALGFKQVNTQNMILDFEFSDEGIERNTDGDEFVIARTLIVAPDKMEFTIEELYMIEIQSFDILSYDSSALNKFNRGNFPLKAIAVPQKNFSGDRKNILDVIHVNDLEDNYIIREPNNLNFIDLGNTTTFNLRNLRLRIVDDNFFPIDVIGVSHIVLLIKD